MLRSIKTRLNWLQTVIDGQKSRRTLNEMSKSHRSRLDTSFCKRWSGSSQLASDKTLSKTACTGAELHCKPTRSVDQLCGMSLLRDNDFTAKAVRDMIAEVEGRKPRKKKPTPQTTIVYAPICCGHPPAGKDESQTGKCSDDGRGNVKTLSGRLARKLQRSASLVNAGLSKQIQTVLDAATVDRCDFVEICCSDAPCLTEAMQRRGLSSFSLLRSGGVETTTHRHVRKILAGLPRNDLRRLGYHLRS